MDSISQEAKHIFISLVDDVSEGDWELRVEEACHGNEVLRQRVRDLLLAHAQPDSRLNQPGIELALTAQNLPPITETVGSVIGPYKLMEQIGEGGMGVVYVAEQAEPVCRKVAFKIIKPGMETKQVIARFEAERHALALMDHPNIARVIDAGTTETGRPYFIMELVRGIPITEYCDKNKLNTQQRLELFITVCRAVQHAHQKGIIHRDIKPTNVLVTLHDGTPVPKVIDFGVAKAISQKLTNQTLYTQFAQMVGTPLYMSPEQAEMSGLDVDTRADVYSLGVLLYELLTGNTPFDRETLDKAGFDEMRRIICEHEPLRPSARVSTLHAENLSTVSGKRGMAPHKLAVSFRGELDWIVMKALEKDRTRRYESAGSFVRDVQRYLSDEPVEACPPSTVYRFRKFARRNKTSIVTIGAVAVALVIGTVVAIWQAVDANIAREAEATQRQLAEANFQTAFEAVDQMLTPDVRYIPPTRGHPRRR